MPELTKKSLLQHADIPAICNVVAKAWPLLLDAQQQELCLESVYEVIADAAARQHNFSLLSDAARAQLELDTDMLLITIDWRDIGTLIFDNGENEAHFWSLIGAKDDKKNKKIFRSLFR